MTRPMVLASLLVCGCPGTSKTATCEEVTSWCDGTCPTYDAARGHDFECDQYYVQVNSEMPLYYGEALYFDSTSGELISVHEWTDNGAPTCSWYGPEISCTTWCTTLELVDTGWQGDAPPCE